MKVQSRTYEHQHKSVTVHEIRQRGGVPYEVERKVCESCRRVLDEKRLRRAAA
jgi:hypothetical protein